MAAFDSTTLARIVEADDLHVAPLRADGTTIGTPTRIWCVAVGDQLYARAYNGARSSWYKAAVAQGAGIIDAAGQRLDVTFAAADSSLADVIDAAYEAKYHGSAYLPPMVGAGPRNAAVIIQPA